MSNGERKTARVVVSPVSGHCDVKRADESSVSALKPGLMPMRRVMLSMPFWNFEVQCSTC